MDPEVEGHHVVVAPQQLDQLGLCRAQPRAQDQRSSPAAARHRDRDTVVVDCEVLHRLCRPSRPAPCRHSVIVGWCGLRQIDQRPRLSSSDRRSRWRGYRLVPVRTPSYCPAAAFGASHTEYRCVSAGCCRLGEHDRQAMVGLSQVVTQRSSRDMVAASQSWGVR